MNEDLQSPLKAAKASFRSLKDQQSCNFISFDRVLSEESLCLRPLLDDADFSWREQQCVLRS